MRLRRICNAISWTILAAVAVSIAAGQTIHGVLDRQLMQPPKEMWAGMMLRAAPASAEQKALLPQAASPDDLVLAARVPVLGRRLRALFVRSRGGELAAYLDGNDDGKFTANEKVVF